MKLNKRLIGHMELSQVDITDPCYDKDVWCRMNSVKVKPGRYSCVVWRDPEEKRNAILGIYLNGRVPDEDKMKCIGTIGVDAGVAGFFPDKPDFNDDTWQVFCNRILSTKKAVWLTDEDKEIPKGFFSFSGYGDGCYDVYAAKRKDEIVALEIYFYEHKDIEPDDRETDDCDSE